jgi:hypothetical protein
MNLPKQYGLRHATTHLHCRLKTLPPHPQAGSLGRSLSAWRLLAIPAQARSGKIAFYYQFSTENLKKITDFHLKKRHFSFLLKRTIKLAKYLLLPLKSIN